MREFTVQYLKSKNLWKRSAGTSFRRHHNSHPTLGKMKAKAERKEQAIRASMCWTKTIMKQENHLEDLLAPMPSPSRPQTLPEPSAPTEEERKLHNLTHADFAPWCPHCVAGRGRENKHSRKNTHEDPEVPVIQFDYQFFSRDGQLVAEESRAATALTGTDTSSGWPIMIFVPHKGVDVYVVKSIMVWINRLGYNKVILQHDQEDALKTVLEQVQQKLGVDRVQLRATPRYSHQSQGGAENCNSTMAGMLRTWLSALRETYPSHS